MKHRQEYEECKDNTGISLEFVIFTSKLVVISCNLNSLFTVETDELYNYYDLLVGVFKMQDGILLINEFYN